MRGGIKSLVKEHCNLDHTCFTVYITEKFLKFQDNNGIGQPAVFLIICRLLLGKLFELHILRKITPWALKLVLLICILHKLINLCVYIN